jgi:hypothetical protein
MNKNKNSMFYRLFLSENDQKKKKPWKIATNHVYLKRFEFRNNNNNKNSKAQPNANYRMNAT